MNSVPIKWDDRVSHFDGVTRIGDFNYADAGLGLVPGSAKWGTDQNGKIASLSFICPCGCRAVCAVPVYPGGWVWNGDLEKPTLTPSIQILNPCRWHGYLKAGVFEPC